jgi:hypothetical protein
MEQEKEMGFKVTDKRIQFQEQPGEDAGGEPTPSPEAKKAEEPNQPKQQHQQSSSMPLPEADFLTLVVSLYTHAQISLGTIPDPVSQQVMQDLPQAKYHIDLLGILQEKTHGNLTAEEEQALEQMLFELRMMYVEANKIIR